MRAMRRNGLVALVVTAVLAMTGCGSSPSPETAEPTPVAIPDTPVGQVAEWVIGVANAEDDTTAAAWDGRLHPDFLAEVPVEEVVELTNRQIRPARPFVATAYTGTERQATVTLEGRIGDPLDLHLSIDAEDKIVGMLLTPATKRTPAESLGEVEKRLAALPADVRVLVTLDEKTLIEADADAPAPLASIFKLYVLDAVAEAVKAGTLSWDDTVVVTDDARSLPSGELQDLPAGTEVPVREAAQKMIEISDNTATDLLLHRVGRDAVEAAAARLDVDDLAGLHPFPTTREVFALLWGGHDDLVEQWSTGGEAAQRAVLDALAAEPFDVSVSDVTDDPGWDRGIEWFASAADITAAHRALHAIGRDVPEVNEILSANPGAGLSFDRDAWPYIAFKGGSSPGVLTGSWLAERADGAVLTVVVLAATDDPAALTAQMTEMFGLVEDVFVLTAKD